MASKLKKGMIGVKAWLVISESGQSFVEEVGKHSIMKRTGLPARDLRALDPVLSYPSSILGRERAIVVNLEHIRAIITATEVLMINSNNPLIVQFVEDLQHRIAFGNANATPPQQVCLYFVIMSVFCSSGEKKLCTGVVFISYDFYLLLMHVLSVWFNDGNLRI